MAIYNDGYGITFGRITPVVVRLMIAMVVVFLLQSLFGRWITPWFALSGEAVGQGMVWQFVTYIFLHQSFMHIFFNLLGLFFFAPEVERAIGGRSFVLVFLMCGALGGLGWLLLSDSHSVCLGASGAVYGILGAFAALNFHRPIQLLLFFVIPVTMKGWMLALVFGLMELMMLVSGPSGGIAYAAHLSGLVAGFIYGVTWAKEGALPFSQTIRSLRGPKLKVLSGSEDGRPSKAERNLDQILEKIAEEGMDSLTKSERKTLDKASQDMRTRGR